MKRTSSFGISSRRSYRFSWNHSTSASSELVVVLQEGGPLPWSKTGLLSNTQKWTVHRDTCVMKQRILLGKDSWVENRRVRVPRRTALPCGSHAFYGDGISSPVVFSLSFWLRVLPGGANGGVSRSAKMDAGEKDSGRWSDMSLFDLSQNSSSWWWLISSMYRTRISCHKTTHEIDTVVPG